MRALFHPLLFTQVCLLACTAGILGSRYPQIGAVALVIIWLCDIPRSLSFLRGAILLACFFLALAYADFRAPEEPQLPSWLAQYVSSPRDRIVEIDAKVVRCDMLPGNRARLILNDARPSNPSLFTSSGAPRGASSKTYFGTSSDALANGGTKAVEACATPLLWTWRYPTTIPLPGDTIRGLYRLGPVRGFLNPGSWDSGEYWRNRGVWYRLRDSSKAVPEIINSKRGGFSPTAWRFFLHDSFRKALPPATPDNSLDGDTVKHTVASRKPKKLAAQEKYLPTEGASLLPALIFGDKSGISTALNELFAKATLSHSLALSGLHLGFAVLAGAACAALACAIRPSLCLALPRGHLTLLCSLPFALLYLWLGQAPYSLLRAAAMLLFSVVIVFKKRPGALLDGLFAALALILAVHPLAFFEIGLQLSALCIVSMSLALPTLTRITNALVSACSLPVRSLPARMVRWALMLLGISLCIQVALLPLTARYFGSTGLLFPLNLIWLPALGFFVLPLSFLALFAIALHMPEFAALLLKLASLPCDALVALLHELDATGMLQSPAMPRPHWLSSLGYWLLLITLPLLISRLRAPRKQGDAGKSQTTLYAAATLFGVILFLLPIGQAIHANRQPAVTLSMLDVGQGQSLLVAWSGIGPKRQSGRIIVDGGGFSGSSFDVGKAIVAPVLTDNALPRLDAVVSTHADIDHSGGLMYLLESFSVPHYYSNADVTPPYRAKREADALARSGLTREILSAGRILEPAPGLRLEILWPKQDNDFPPGNNSSLLIRLVWDGQPLALLCGDIEIAAMQKILELYPAAKLSAQALVLPHHGSASSCLPEFYRAVGPRLALASTGYANRWNFPSGEVREALAAQAVPLLTTADKGRVDLRWSSPLARPELVTVLE